MKIFLRFSGEATSMGYRNNLRIIEGSKAKKSENNKSRQKIGQLYEEVYIKCTILFLLILLYNEDRHQQRLGYNSLVSGDVTLMVF